MEEKVRRAFQLLRWGFMIAGGAEIFFGGLAYSSKSFVMMGFLFIEGISKIIVAYCLPFVLTKTDKEEKYGKANEEI
jgi:hypothetical protein